MKITIKECRFMVSSPPFSLGVGHISHHSIEKSHIFWKHAFTWEVNQRFFPNLFSFLCVCVVCYRGMPNHIKGL